MEINNIRKNINETVKQHNEIIKDKEQNHKNSIEKMEENKLDLINKHNDVIADLNSTIEKQMDQ